MQRKGLIYSAAVTDGVIELPWIKPVTLKHCFQRCFHSENVSVKKYTWMNLIIIPAAHPPGSSLGSKNDDILPLATVASLYGNILRCPSLLLSPRVSFVVSQAETKSLFPSSEPTVFKGCCVVMGGARAPTARAACVTRPECLKLGAHGGATWTRRSPPRHRR